MDNSSQGMLVLAKNLLAPLDREVVFVGGATVHLHIDDPAATPVRTTKDVDVLIEAATYLEFTFRCKTRQAHCRSDIEDLMFALNQKKSEIRAHDPVFEVRQAFQ